MKTKNFYKKKRNKSRKKNYGGAFFSRRPVCTYESEYLQEVNQLNNRVLSRRINNLGNLNFDEILGMKIKDTLKTFLEETQRGGKNLIGGVGPSDFQESLLSRELKKKTPITENQLILQLPIDPEGPHFLNTKRRQYEFVKMIPPEILLSYYIVDKLPEEFKKSFITEEIPIQRPERSYILENLNKLYKNTGSIGYSKEILPESIIYNAIKSAAQVGRELTLNTIDIDNQLRTQPLDPENIQSSDLTRIYASEKNSEICNMFKSFVDAGDNLTAGGLCFMVFVYGGEILPRINALYNQIFPSFNENNNRFLQNIFNRLSSDNTINQLQKLKELNNILNTLGLKKFYTFDLLIVLSLLANVSTYQSKFSSVIMNKLSQSPYIIMNTISNDVLGKPGLSSLKDYTDKYLPEINSLFGEDVKDYLYKYTTTIQVIGTPGQPTSANVVIYKRSSMFYYFDDGEKKILLAIMLVNETFNFMRETYIVNNRLRWVLNDENYNLLKAIPNSDTEYPFLNCIKPIAKTITTKPIGVSTGITALGARTGAFAKQMFTKKVEQPPMASEPYAEVAPADRPFEGDATLKKMEATEMQSKPIGERIKSTAQNIYSRVSENPEGALAAATIGSALIAIPLALTLAGGKRRLTKRRKRENKRKTKKNKRPKRRRKLKK
jgi:hypothetical protein